MEQGIPVLPEWLFFNRVNIRARNDVEIGPARFLLRYSTWPEFSVSRKKNFKNALKGIILQYDSIFVVYTAFFSSLIVSGLAYYTKLL